MSSHPDTVRSGIAPRRRNGRPQACEPCRARKVACDHRMPVCSRCKSGSNASACIYPASTQYGWRLNQNASTPLSQDSVRQDASAPTLLTAPTHEGYLGATSYKHAMHEAQSSISTTSPMGDFDDAPTNSKIKGSQSPIMCNARTYEAAMRILRAIPPKAQAYEISEAHVNPNDAWCRLATRRMHDSLWDTFGKELEGNRSTESLVRLATKISENSAYPLREDFTDPRLWLDSFTGTNMRWEGLGILFTHWSFGTVELGQSKRFAASGIKPFADQVVKFRDCAWDAVEITRSTASANTLLLHLLYTQECLESIISGDESKLTMQKEIDDTLTYIFAGLQHSRLHGEVISLLTCLGFHAIKGDMNDIGICTQIKRRLFGKVFHGDKVVSTYAGRPPMLSRRFVSTPLPLDLSDEVLLGITPWRDDLVDEFGWNTAGKIYSSTLLRARAQMGFIRDSILSFNLQAEGAINIPELL